MTGLCSCFPESGHENPRGNDDEEGFRRHDSNASRLLPLHVVPSNHVSLCFTNQDPAKCLPLLTRIIGAPAISLASLPNRLLQGLVA